MTGILFEDISKAEYFPLQYVVVAARCQDKWIFVRHKQRNTWEIPGGHIEAGETIAAAAKRELWEETGAVNANICPVCIYGVDHNGNISYGALMFAMISEWEPLPESFEMAERILSDKLPAELTYPDIQPALYAKIQEWRNLQNSTDELWDVYDENRCLTGRIHRRGDPLAKGEYHLVVHVWTMNREGKFLLTKRSPNKGFPNMWESAGGSALAGDDSLTAALREVQEEAGLVLDPGKGILVSSVRREDSFRDLWLFFQDFDLEDVVLRPGETMDKMSADTDAIVNMLRSGELVPYDYLDDLFQAAGMG